MRAGRYGHSMDILGSQILLFGGSDGKSVLSDIWM